MIPEQKQVKGEVYSTEEVRIGTWIDGKPLYRCVVNFGELPNSNEKEIKWGPNNLDKLVKIYGIALKGDKSASISLPYVHTSPITLFWEESRILIITTSDRSSFTESYITLEYTKTTD